MIDNLNRYVKVRNHSNWFLVLNKEDKEPNNLSEIMQEKILRSQVCNLHNENTSVDDKEIGNIEIVGDLKINS